MPDDQLESRTDEELAALAADNADAVGMLLARCLPLIRFLASQYGKGIDAEDLTQEGLIALLHAIPRFVPSEGYSFRTFAQTCIRNRMRSVLRREQNAAAPVEDLVKVLEERGALVDPDTPESILREKENYEECRMQVMARLSDLEWQILQCVMTGASYAETAGMLGIPEKSVDNAMQRIRRKMRAERS